MPTSLDETRVLESFDFEWSGQPYRAELWRRARGAHFSPRAVWVLFQGADHVTVFAARDGETLLSVRLELTRFLRRYHCPKGRG